MRLLKYLIALLIFPMALAGQPNGVQPVSALFRTDTLYLNSAEVKLAKLLNNYRASLNLPKIKLSASLSLVARQHVYDLSENYKYGSSCNLHSWSQSRFWSSCCYTADHKRASCMWDKPRELTSYKGDGYEIAFFSNYDYADPNQLVTDAIEGWKTSIGHHQLIVNTGKWDTAIWKAMGVGVYGGYVVVWFGEVADENGEPRICLK